MIFWCTTPHVPVYSFIHPSHRIKNTPKMTDNNNQKSTDATFSPEFPLFPTSKGLPPPPKASGLLLAALVRWAWLDSVVGWPLLKAVVRKGEGADDPVLVVTVVDVDGEDAELVEIDVLASAVEVCLSLDEVVALDLDFEEDSVVAVVTDALLAVVDDSEATVALEEAVEESVY